ncbi:MAG TPA: tRNA (adenosine(37)-N6)-threonylcarbamoyltransferase complex dimerization subunit type 1 TsaB [Flavobacterium sp.]|nr:tRNA (adenosine(37)-N6)-threonylcarbamoyltransferase complex dimerization subunit type 1 TsaB [Flavobacterium sp.]
MPYILNIETATKNCSVAIAKDGQTLICSEIAEQGYSHAEKLHVFIEEVLQRSGVSFTDLSAIAVSQGPGSYTGLRIGVSAAKGLCYALGIPLIAVDTLQILAAQVTIDSGLIVPMLDARRMEVYSAIFDTNHHKTRPTEAQIITSESFIDCKETLYFVGDGAQKCRPLLTRDNFVFLDEIVYPSAREMSALGYEKFKKNDTVDVAYFEPNYLKDFMIAQKGS